MALDASSGCARWVFDSPTRLRSSLTYGPLGTAGPDAIVYGDAEGFVYALAASTGELIWSQDVRSHGRGVRLTGAMVLHEERVYVPVSASGVSQGGTPTFECCVGHGEIVALDAATGAVDWVYHTMPEADYTGERNSLGVRLRGPSGAPIWSTPTVDAARGLLFVTTGENTSHPATPTSDAVIALDLATGAQRWVFQGLWNDVWNTACGRVAGPNCPNQHPSTLADKDLAGQQRSSRRTSETCCLLGRKPEICGHLIRTPGLLSGISAWVRARSAEITGGLRQMVKKCSCRSMTRARLRGTYVPRPGVYSFYVDTGEPGWFRAETPACDNRADWLKGCDNRYGHSVTPLLIDGVLITGTIDGRLLALDAETGDVLFEFDTVREYDAVNGVQVSVVQ